MKVTIKKYFLNCFLLLIPILLWNLFLVDSLPKSYSSNIFWNDVPRLIGYGENILRVAVFGLPVIMILSVKKRIEKIGLAIFLMGMVTYFSSWLAMIYVPESSWGKNAIGFTAPAYTTIILFTGIGLIGNRSFFRIPRISLIYIGLSVLFVIFHTLHAYIIFQRL